MAAGERFEGWGILEIMGHRQVAGMIREVVLFGAPMAQVDVPEVPAVPERKDGSGWVCQRAQPPIPAHTQYYGGSAVFSMSPCTEEIARAAAERFRASPPQPLAMPSSRLIEAPAPDADLVEDDEDEEKCESCSNVALRQDSDGVPLCDECYAALPTIGSEEAAG